MPPWYEPDKEPRTVAFLYFYMKHGMIDYDETQRYWPGFWKKPLRREMR
jgi:hypothetical protein